MKFGKVDSVQGIEFTLPKVSEESWKVLSQYKKTQRPEIRIGCSVWSNKDYVGTVYPQKTPQTKFLMAYANQFNSVEVNATRYGMPKIQTLEGWRDKVSDGFKFSFKVPQPVTNRKDLNDSEGVARMDHFIEGIDRMGNKAGTSFILLPQHFGMEKFDQLELFLNKWPNEMPATLELRGDGMVHESAIRKLLMDHNMSLCVTDTPGRRDIVHNELTNEELYIRYAGTMDVAANSMRIESWIERISKLIDHGLQRVYFMIHQPADERGSALEVARQLGMGLRHNFPKAQITIPTDYRSATLF